MNGRQAAKLAAKKVEELEHLSQLQARDIQDYNQAIQAMIGGASPCSWCEENRIGDCTAPERGGKGCSEWWLRYREDSPVNEALEAGKGEAENEGENLLLGRSTRGE